MVAVVEVRASVAVPSQYTGMYTGNIANTFQIARIEAETFLTSCSYVQLGATATKSGERIEDLTTTAGGQSQPVQQVQ